MATRNIAPVADGEGNIGTSTKKWAKGWFNELHVESNVTDGTNTTTISDIKTHIDTTSGNPHGVDFTELDDTPSSYAGNAGKGIKVNSTETGLEFTDANIDAHSSRHEAGGADEIDVRGLQGGWLTADTEANRPSAGRKDRYFYATDTGKLYYDDGTNWIEIKPSPATHGNEFHNPDMLPLDTSSAIEAYMSGNKWLSVATSGIVSFPKQSAVRAYLSADQTIPDNSTTKIAIDTIVFDIQGEFDTTQSRFTASESGIYLVGGKIRWQDSGPATADYCISVRKNGASIANVWNGPGGSTHHRVTSHIVIILQMDAGDYIEWTVYQDSGESLNIKGGTIDSLVFVYKLA